MVLIPDEFTLSEWKCGVVSTAFMSDPVWCILYNIFCNLSSLRASIASRSICSRIHIHRKEGPYLEPIPGSGLILFVLVANFYSIAFQISYILHASACFEVFRAILYA